MTKGDPVHLSHPIRHHATGAILPRDGRYVSETQNLGRTLVLVSFGEVGTEYLFPEEIELCQTPLKN